MHSHTGWKIHCVYKEFERLVLFRIGRIHVPKKDNIFSQNSYIFCNLMYVKISLVNFKHSA